MDLLKIKITDKEAKEKALEFLNKHEIVYFTKKKSIYVRPDEEADILSYLDAETIDYDSKFKEDVDVSNPAFSVWNAKKEKFKKDLPEQTDKTESSSTEKKNIDINTFEETVLQKIDDEYALTEDEIKELLFDGYVVEEIEGDSGRWEKSMTSIVQIKDRYFSINWQKGLTEMQEDSFPELSPEEVESYEETVVVKKWRPIEKTKEETVEETEEELEL